MTFRRALRLLVPGFVALLVLSTAGVAQAHTFTYTRSVSISVSHGSDDNYTFSGTVSVTNADAEYTAGECTAGKTVTLLKDGVVAGTATTSASGVYSITLSVTANHDFVASVGTDLGNTTHHHNHICGAAQSSSITTSGHRGPSITCDLSVSPGSGSPGDKVVFTYLVTNTGPTSLDVSVSDSLFGPVGSPPTLTAGQSMTLTHGYTLPNKSGPIRDVATASGVDTSSGVTVSCNTSAKVFTVLGETITSPPIKSGGGGTAFTGSAVVIPLTAGALVLLLIGAGLLWLGRRRHADSA